jgi:hypothetical protein
MFLAVNLKPASTLGITVKPTLLGLADEVIEIAANSNTLIGGGAAATALARARRHLASKSAWWAERRRDSIPEVRTVAPRNLIGAISEDETGPR